MNGSVFGKISMEKSLRQGDPLSPFLFIIMLELLSKMITSWEGDRKFNGVKLERTAPSISHLLFADDVLIFCRANEKEVRNVLKCLYYKWTSQVINFEKFLKERSQRVKSSD